MKTTTTLIVALALLLTTAAAANAATATHYLLSRQTASGGFAESGSGSPSAVVTEWTVMGLRAAGVAPAGVHRSGGKTAIAYLAARAGSWTDAYDLERGILAVVAARRNPAHSPAATWSRRCGARSAATAASAPPPTRPTGACSRCAPPGAPVPARTLAYIRSRRHRNGGYAWSISAAPDSNDTAAAVLALHAAGVGCGNVAVSRAPRLPAQLPGLVARLRAPARERRRQPVDVVGDPGPARLRPPQRPRAPVAARPPAAERRLQLPAGDDDHARVRDGAGAPRRARPLVPDPIAPVSATRRRRDTMR